MSGPIVRTGTNPKFWANYDRIFGSKSAGQAATKKKAASKGKSQLAVAAKKGTQKKAAGKKAGKKKG